MTDDIFFTFFTVKSFCISDFSTGRINFIGYNERMNTAVICFMNGFFKTYFIFFRSFVITSYDKEIFLTCGKIIIKNKIKTIFVIGTFKPVSVFIVKVSKKICLFILT